MAIEAITQALQASTSQPATLQAADAGYNVTLHDVARFEQALGGGVAPDAAAGRGGATTLPTATSLVESGPLKALLGPLQRINLDAGRLAEHKAGTPTMPSELMMLTLRSQEFLFHCELTSNVANRTSDGIQQLFRQQS